MMTRMIAIAVLVVGCGKGGENAACSVDADCADGLRCALLQGADGAKQEKCVNPNGAWDLSTAPGSRAGWRAYAVPVGVAVGATGILLLALRASVRAREKRKRAKRAATTTG